MSPVKEVITVQNIQALKGQLLSMDDEGLRRLITTVAAAYGADEARVRELTSDIPALRSRLRQMNGQQLADLVSALGRR